MKRPRAVRLWLIGLSLVSVGIAVGCAGAGAAVRAVGRGAASGTRAVAPVARPAVHIPSPSAYRPTAVTSGQFKIGNQVNHGGGGSGYGHVPVDAFVPNGSDDRKR